MKNICVVSSSIPPDYSGAGLAAYRYSQRLQERKCLAFICTRTKKPLDNLIESKVIRIRKWQSESKVKIVKNTLNYL